MTDTSANAPLIPEAYRTGRVSFMGVELLAAPGVLVPREETELLGRTALAALRHVPHDAPRVIDMCCGAGNLGCAVAVHDPRVQLWASDLTPECVALATRNAAHTGVAHRMVVVGGDLFAPLEPLGLAGTIDVIVCNPPYISQGRLAGDRAELLVHEPREAFDGGPYGLTIHQRVVREAAAYLRPGGTLHFEIGAGQDRQMARLLDRAGVYDAYEMIPDASGQVRVVSARLRPLTPGGASAAPDCSAP